MKTIFLITAVLIASLAGIETANAKNYFQGDKNSITNSSQTINQNSNDMKIVKDSLQVSGKCGMCKTRIEKATNSVKGVVSASWNETAQVLNYSYNGSVSKEEISKALNKVGHDTELGKAPDEVYNALPTCCRYR